MYLSPGRGFARGNNIVDAAGLPVQTCHAIIAALMDRLLPPELREPQADENTISAYSNYAGVQATPDEFILRFCQKPLDAGGRPLETVRIYMSLPHAKRLINAMARNISDYEAVFGEIPVEPTFTPEGKERLEKIQQQP